MYGTFHVDEAAAQAETIYMYNIECQEETCASTDFAALQASPYSSTQECNQAALESLASPTRQLQPCLPRPSRLVQGHTDLIHGYCWRRSRQRWQVKFATPWVDFYGPRQPRAIQYASSMQCRQDWPGVLLEHNSTTMAWKSPLIIYKYAGV